MDFLFPDVGEGITEGKLIKWLVKPGDTVKADQVLAEVETDKAVIELPSPAAGTISELLAQEHDTITVGTAILRIDTGSGTTATQQAPQRPEQTAPTSPATPTPPLQTVRPTPTIPQEDVPLALPAVRKLAAQMNVDISRIRGTGPEGRITEEDVRAASGSPIPAPRNTAQEASASPSVRQKARELKIDIATITPSEDSGRITLEDVERAAREPQGSRTTMKAPPQTAARAPRQTERITEDKRIPLTNLRPTNIANLATSKNTTIPVTHTDTIDMTEITRILEKEATTRSIKLTYLSFIAKAASVALTEHPHLNAELDENAREIILHAAHHIGIAVDTPDGLFVPVLKDVQARTILNIASQIADLAERARDRKLAPDEMRGSTFTLTSVGSIGGEVFTPVINYPNSAILGIGHVGDKPAILNGKAVARKLCVLSLTYDHRIIDGAEAARFMQELKTLLEDPGNLLVHLW